MRKHALAYLVAVALLWLFMAQAVGNLSAQSPVVDEPSHIARAMAYWRVGDLRLQLGHPPLIHALAGLPLLLEPTVPDVSTLQGWQAPFDRETLSRHALWDPERAFDRIVFLSRWPVLMLGVLLGALVFRWAGERFGLRAAFVALFLVTFDPNLLAHSALITTDLGVTFFILLALYSFDRWLRRRSRIPLIVSGLTLGLALSAKFSAVILIPVMGLVALLVAWRNRRWRPILVSVIVIGLSSAFTVWAVYRFEIGRSAALHATVPAPKFWDGMLRVQEREEEGRMAFLFGQMTPHGWWYYFPVALAVKTPLPTLFLLVVAIASALASVYRQWKRRNPLPISGHTLSMLTLILLPVLYLGLSMTSSQNAGYRYILPILPFLFISISNIQYLIPKRIVGTFAPARSAGVGYWILSAWLVIEAVLIYPYHLAYFNEAAGGPDNGYKILADSNVDWGQDVKRVKTWLDEHAGDVGDAYIGDIYWSVFSGSVPERYGLRVLPAPGPYQSPDEYGFRRFTPAPGIYVIGASAWQGLRFHNPDTYDWFRRQQPLARIGHSFFVYQVLPAPVIEKWAAVCYAPDGPIDGDGLASGLGRTNLRSIFFDCRNAWVYLHDGGPGYYFVPVRGEPVIADTMLQGMGQPIYRDRGDPVMSKDNPGFTIYRWDGETNVLARIQSLTLPPGGEFNFGPASLIGYELGREPFKPGDTITLWVWWRANSAGEVLLSAYAHLMNRNQLVAGDDGLGVPPQMWQPGDVIVQRHLLKLPGDLAPGEYTLHVGLYSADANRRYPLLPGGDEHPMLTAIKTVGR